MFALCFRNGTCQRPLHGKLVPLPDGLDSQFEVDYGYGHVGRFQVIFTNYRTALVYQCLQMLNDGACLPGQVIVELLSRTVDMNPRLVPYSSNSIYVNKLYYVLERCATLL